MTIAYTNMQDNTITLAVDTANTGSTTATAYSRYTEELNRSTYIGATHVPNGNVDTLTFGRSMPTKNGTFLGTGKTQAKFTRTVSVLASDGTTLKVPLIIDINFSVPVGTTSGDVVKLRQTAIALLDTDTIMNLLNTTLAV